ncbi:MAG TPA: prolyl oligopeptidase family serine peptidase [Chitinophagales bacterium]|jgi:pimeloyl-ACP methyl ester carboxylesterase|nr:prolyl oligopeptidase family serine peptidase [Chitinophagales bacterium]HQV78554.1 prolyl oligopeptidase family serine peptidase [Chitinophagales bacterium]HQW79060.1 prolyl oligopeptidase family serine peptidase [Chitinophagales bacterium]HRB67414.1 prolyl oligopeptidase family serine peptidase [Chitinophagales bacterium]
MQKTTLSINGSCNRLIEIDIYHQKNTQYKPLIIFCHGFKGFKNWGHFDLIATEFAKQNYVFAKFNFSFNGTTIQHPDEFADLDAFGKNNFTTELNDLKWVLDFLEKNALDFEINTKEICLIGHSRGGGIAILKAQEDARIKKLITWASIKDFEDFFKNLDLEKWKQDGVLYTLNSRTQQQMPLNYQLLEDYQHNKTRLNIKNAASKINIPWLIIHGKHDRSVPFSNAEYLHQQNIKSVLFSIENADHTFGGKHPFNEDVLPKDTQIVINTCMTFLNQY